MQRAILALLLSLLVACLNGTPEPASGSRPSPPTRFALVGVTVIDVANGAAQPDRAVIVEGDRIVAVVGSSEVPASPPARVVNARGKFVIPGLWDMHVHFSDPLAGKLFVANGVTGVRVMWGNPRVRGANNRYHFDLRDLFDKQEAIGPRMVIASEILDGPKPIWAKSVSLSSPAEGRQAVDDAKRAGYDFIKVYTALPRDIYFAIADESKKMGIPFAGHVPDSVGVAEASDAGQKSIEHLTGVQLAVSSREQEIRGRRAQRRNVSRYGPEGAQLRREMMAEIAASYDPDRAAQLFAKFVANGTWHCPTLKEIHSMATLDDSSRMSDPRMRYVGPTLRKRWNPQTDFRTAQRTPEDYVAFRSGLPPKFALVGAMHKAGVPLLAGTDEGNPFVFAGFTLHEELGFLVQAGLTPIDALRTATLNPARYFGREQTMGTVTAGKVADLVVLDADPRTDIANTTKIYAVVARGSLYERSDLDKILEEMGSRSD